MKLHCTLQVLLDFVLAVPIVGPLMLASSNGVGSRSAIAVEARGAKRKIMI